MALITTEDKFDRLVSERIASSDFSQYIKMLALEFEEFECDMKNENNIANINLIEEFNRLVKNDIVNNQKSVLENNSDEHNFENSDILDIYDHQDEIFNNDTDEDSKSDDEENQLSESKNDEEENENNTNDDVDEDYVVDENDDADDDEIKKKKSKKTKSKKKSKSKNNVDVNNDENIDKKQQDSDEIDEKEIVKEGEDKTKKIKKKKTKKTIKKDDEENNDNDDDANDDDTPEDGEKKKKKTSKKVEKPVKIPTKKKQKKKTKDMLKYESEMRKKIEKLIVEIKRYRYGLSQIKSQINLLNLTVPSDSFIDAELAITIQTMEKMQGEQNNTQIVVKQLTPTSLEKNDAKRIITSIAKNYHASKMGGNNRNNTGIHHHSAAPQQRLAVVPQIFINIYFYILCDGTA